jgi:DNA-binding NarL/FixJ family response regulator
MLSATDRRRLNESAFPPVRSLPLFLDRRMPAFTGGKAETMDQWTEASWLHRADAPVLRAVSGRSVRVLRRHAEVDVGYEPDELIGAHPAPLEEFEPDAIRILVISDDLLARRGMLAALDDAPGLLVVRDRGPGPGVGSAVRAGNPEVLLLHGLSGAEAEPVIAAARAAAPNIRVLTICARPDRDADPGHGMLPASSTPEEVVAAVRLAAAGYVLRHGSAQGRGQRDGRAAAVRLGLTERECDVLELVATGMSNAEIAGALTLSEHTVKSHVQNLLGKLKLRNRIHAVIHAFDTGLVRPAGG